MKTLIVAGIDGAGTRKATTGETEIETAREEGTNSTSALIDPRTVNKVSRDRINSAGR